MRAVTFTDDTTFVERHALALFVVLLVLLVAAALTSADRPLLAFVSDAVSAGAAR